MGGAEQLPINYETFSVTQTGIASARGRREDMEDAHIASQFAVEVGDQTIIIDITGVFDGHGGSQWSDYASKHIVEHLTRRIQEFNKDGLSDAGIWNALKIAFVDLDVTKTDDYPTDDSGTTANVALRINGDLWVANLGDSRAMLVDSNGKTKQLSEDAKPDADKYLRAIKKRGGVFMRGKVNDRLATARSLGDHGLEGAISARPKITRIRAADLKGKTLVQTCDGLPDIATSDELGQAAHEALNRGDTPAITAAKLVGRAFLAESGDNLSAVVTLLDIPSEN